MAITVVTANASGKASSSSVSSDSWSHTITGNSNRVLYVVVSLDDNVNHNPSCTYNGSGTGVTRIFSDGFTSSDRAMAVFRIKQADLPSAGTYTVALSWTTAIPYCATAVELHGVDQTTSDDTVASSEGIDGSQVPDQAVSSETGDVVIGAICENGATSSSWPTNENGTLVKKDWSTALGQCVAYWPGAATVTADFNCSDANQFRVLAFNVNAAAGASAPTITDAGDEVYINAEPGIVISGANFSASGNTVKFSPTADVNDSGAVTQTITTEGVSSITINAVKGTLPIASPLYLYVTNASAQSNASGYSVQLALPNAGYLFDAAGEKLETTGALSLTNQSFTMFCWIKVADGTPASTQTVFSLGNSGFGSDRYCSLQLVGTDGTGRALVYESTGSSSTSAADCQNDTWYALAGLFTVNGSNQVTDVQAWAWNGTAEVLANGTTGLTKTMSSFNTNRVGLSRTGSGELTGLACHAAVWNKLLSAGELTSLITTPPLGVAFANLIAYWPLSANALANVGGTTLDMTATGATLTAGDGPYPPEIYVEVVRRFGPQGALRTLLTL